MFYCSVKRGASYANNKEEIMQNPLTSSSFFCDRLEWEIAQAAVSTNTSSIKNANVIGLLGDRGKSAFQIDVVHYLILMKIRQAFFEARSDYRPNPGLSKFI